MTNTNEHLVFGVFATLPLDGAEYEEVLQRGFHRVKGFLLKRAPFPALVQAREMGQETRHNSEALWEDHHRRCRLDWCLHPPAVRDVTVDFLPEQFLENFRALGPAVPNNQIRIHQLDAVVDLPPGR